MAVALAVGFLFADPAAVFHSVVSLRGPAASRSPGASRRDEGELGPVEDGARSDVSRTHGPDRPRRSPTRRPRSVGRERGREGGDWEPGQAGGVGERDPGHQAGVVTDPVGGLFEVGEGMIILAEPERIAAATGYAQGVLGVVGQGARSIAPVRADPGPSGSRPSGRGRSRRRRGGSPSRGRSGPPWDSPARSRAGHEARAATAPVGLEVQAPIARRRRLPRSQRTERLARGSRANRSGGRRPPPGGRPPARRPRRSGRSGRGPGSGGRRPRGRRGPRGGPRGAGDAGAAALGGSAAEGLGAPIGRLGRGRERPARRPAPRRGRPPGA